MGTNDDKQDHNLRKFLTGHSEELSLLTGHDVEDEWKRMSYYTHQSQSRLWLKVLRYAAVVVMAFIFGVVATNYVKKNPSQVQYAVVSIPDGQMGNVILPDGTEVSLNSGSTLRYPDRFDSGQRDVYFSGEAYFHVKSDERHPFHVHLDNYMIKVTGTSFNVRSYAGLPLETALIEGKVNILDNQGKELASLLPNQIFYFNKAGNEMRIDTVNAEVYTMWKDGKLLLNNETLGEIAEKLERWYSVEIRFTDNKIKQNRLTGTILKNKPFDQVLKILTLKESLNYSIQTRSNEPDIVTFSFHEQNKN